MSSDVFFIYRATLLVQFSCLRLWYFIVDYFLDVCFPEALAVIVCSLRYGAESVAPAVEQVVVIYGVRVK